MKKLYKVLVDGKSCHGGDLKWSLPKKGKPGKWHTTPGNIEICNNGLHLTKQPYNWFKWGCDIYEAEGIDCFGGDENKSVYRKARLIKLLPKPKWLIETEQFINDIKNTPFLKPDGKPDKKWKLFTAPTMAAAWDAAWDAARDAAWNAAGNAARDAAGDAARDAAWNAAGAAARNAARDAAWNAAGNAAGDAARDAAWDAAWNAARDAAGAAARNAARNAARDAAGAAARNAARDAALMARISICSDLSIDNKHLNHAKKRWEVWEKGYFLLCDINGILYVYSKEQ